MEEKIKELRAAIEQASADVTDKARLSDFWQKYLSKNGEVAGLTKSLRDVPKEDRPAVGKTINEFKQWAEAQYQALSEQVEKAALEARNAAETVDITMPAKIRQTGSLHPITLVKNEIIDVFAGMGFEIYQRRPDPRHGHGKAAHQGAGPGPRVPFRLRRDPLSDVPPDGRPRR